MGARQTREGLSTFFGVCAVTAQLPRSNYPRFDAEQAALVAVTRNPGDDGVPRQSGHTDANGIANTFRASSRARETKI
ncbi:hypothetical protein GCM10010392_56250 [Streptomyces clavifer]|nr:hypothetical protein GCM10010392_56250 [Streptomyces clavifer]